MRNLRREILSLVLLVTAFAFPAVLYTRLPERLPTHWNIHGQPDGFTGKPWGPFLLPLVMTGLYLLLLLLPRISPKGYRFESFRGVWEIVRTAILAFLFFVHILVLLSATGVRVEMDRAIPVGVGLLLVLLGNYLGKTTKNFFLGIRTPWTLASDEVWLRTHRLGGKLFVLAGLVCFVSGLAGGSLAPAMAAVGAAALASVVYSYVVYRRIEGFKDTEPPVTSGGPPGS